MRTFLLKLDIMNLLKSRTEKKRFLLKVPKSTQGLSTHSLKRNVFSYRNPLKRIPVCEPSPLPRSLFHVYCLKFKMGKAMQNYFFDAFAPVILQKCFLLKSVYSQVWLQVLF